MDDPSELFANFGDDSERCHILMHANHVEDSFTFDLAGTTPSMNVTAGDSVSELDVTGSF